MSVTAQPWWPDLVGRLVDEPLAVLAREFGAGVEELEAALRAVSAGGPVREEPWWPEVVRRVAAGGSINDLARRFGTNTRRLRRGLARAGVRAGGLLVEGRGHPALAAFRDRLGREPDEVIAREAGVSPDVVKGERRLFGIGPYLRLKAPRKPEPRRRRRLPPPEPQVIRRRGRSPRADAGELPPAADRDAYRVRLEIPEAEPVVAEPEAGPRPSRVPRTGRRIIVRSASARGVEPAVRETRADDGTVWVEAVAPEPPAPEPAPPRRARRGRAKPAPVRRARKAEPRRARAAGGRGGEAVPRPPAASPRAYQVSVGGAPPVLVVAADLVSALERVREHLGVAALLDVTVREVALLG